MRLRGWFLLFCSVSLFYKFFWSFFSTTFSERKKISQCISWQANMDRYSRIKRCGVGAFGSVYEARDNETGEVVAVKCIKFGTEDDSKESAITEAHYLNHLHHPNLVVLRDVIKLRTEWNLILDCHVTNLQEFLLSDVKPLEKDLLRIWWKQLLDVLGLFHENRLFHLDMKTQNVLLSRSGNLILCDLGSVTHSRQVSVLPPDEEISTLNYRAPELILGHARDVLTSACDVWSLACVFVETLLRRPLSYAQNEWEHLIRLFQLFGTPNNDSWPSVEALPHFSAKFPKWPPGTMFEMLRRYEFIDEQLLDLLQKMFRYDPAQRISVREALEHPFLQRDNALTDLP
jgi:serine/threonine protein kinase